MALSMSTPNGGDRLLTLQSRRLPGSLECQQRGRNRPLGVGTGFA
jgi:hypothetical protein